MLSVCRKNAIAILTLVKCPKKVTQTRFAYAYMILVYISHTDKSYSMEEYFSSLNSKSVNK